MNLKEVARSVLNFLHLDLTKNLEYDRLTKTVINRTIKDGWNCVDVGCHKGEILDAIVRKSPKGEHWAFEPIPVLYNDLKSRYHQKVNVFNAALSDKNGNTTFNFVKNDPAYSGINKRDYKVVPDIEEIEVELKKLDDIIPEDKTIQFIKIDVEGAELSVLKGAREVISRSKPIIIFEFGLGASNYYGASPDDLYSLLCEDLDLKIYTLKNWLKKSTSFDREGFRQCYNSGDEYYFIAS